MTYQLNSSEARLQSRSNLTIFDEVNALMRQVIQASDAGEYEITVDDGTTMTECSPVITVTGTEVNPSITAGMTVIVAGSTITLGTTGTSLNAVIADINDAEISGLTASKDSAGHLVLTYNCSQSVWTLLIGSGTANSALGLTAGTASANSTTGVDYYSVWTGVTADRRRDDEMTRVVKYFENLGYNITQVANTTSAKTFKWMIYW
jgi:hypothetical protein